MSKNFLKLIILSVIGLQTQANDNIEKLSNLSIEELGGIVTSVSKKPENSFTASSSVFVLTNQDIMDSGYKSLVEVLRSVPGLHVARTESKSWAVTSRGFNDGFGNKLLVLIDGRSVYTPLFSGVYWDVQDSLINDIDRIEVIRGPGAALWGANAINGVINIITKDSFETTGKYAEAGLGNQESGYVAFRHGANIDKNSSFRSYIKGRRLNESKTVSGNDGGNDWHKSQAGFRYDYDDFQKYEVTVQGDIYTGLQDLDITVPTLDNSSYNKFVSDELELGGGNLLAKLSLNHDEDTNSQLQVYFDQANRYYSEISQNIMTFDIDGQHSKKIGEKNNLIFGLGYRLVHDQLQGKNLTYWSPVEDTNHLFSAFLQDTIDLTKVFKVTIGSKLEHNSFTGFEFQPSIRGALNLGKNFVWISASRAVRTPSRSENDLSLAVSGNSSGIIRLLGNEDYDSTKVNTYELGYRRYFDQNLFDITTFVSEYKGLRTNIFDLSKYSFPDNSVPLLSINGQDAISYGVESSYSWKVDKSWEVDFSYSLIKLDVDNSSSNLERTQGFENTTPKHQLSIISRKDIRPNIRLINSLYYVDSLKNINVGSYYKFDSNISYFLENGIKLSLKSENIFDDYHPEFSNPLYTEQNEIPRSVFGEISWRF